MANIFFGEPLEGSQSKNNDLVERLKKYHNVAYLTTPALVDKAMKSCCYSDQSDLIIYDTTGFCEKLDNSERARIFTEHFKRFWGKTLFLFLLDEGIFEGVRDMMDESMFYSVKLPYEIDEIVGKIEEILE